MRYRICDIETCAHDDAANWLDPVKPDARLTDPVKVAKSIEEKTAERNDKLGLDPDCCRIVALGWFDVGNGDPVCMVCKDESAEATVLKLFWSTYRQQETKLVTFYGLSFDLPVLLRRSMYLDVAAPPLNLDRYRTPHIDVFQRLTYNGALKTTHGLKFYAKRFGFTTLDKVDGSEIAGLVAAGEWEQVRDHCLSDVGLTHATANRLGLLELAPIDHSMAMRA